MLGALALCWATRSPDRLELVLEPRSQTIRAGERPTFDITLRNTGGEPCTVAKVRDGSLEHSVTPSVGWSCLSNPSESHPAFPKPLQAWCGNVNSISKQDLETLRPTEQLDLGKSFNLKYKAPMLMSPGTYRLVFYYRNDPKQRHETEADFTPDQVLARKELLRTMPCLLRSNEVTVVIEP